MIHFPHKCSLRHTVIVFEVKVPYFSFEEEKLLPDKNLKLADFYEEVFGVSTDNESRVLCAKLYNSESIGPRIGRSVWIRPRVVCSWDFRGR